ncbi:MAG: HAD family hydrolase [Thermoplasmata archaeon]|nr:HAD family hydrolase [Thermoplasmata archaeon]
MSARLETLFFDIDGTLCEYGLAPNAALRRACLGAGIDADLDHHEYYDLYKVVQAERPAAGYEEVSDEAYRRLLAAHGWGDPAMARRVAASYRADRLASIELYPETREVLDTLYGEYPLGIISNGPGEIQWAKIKKFRLRPYFTTIVISGEVGTEKPEPGIFRLALERMNGVAETSAHVGDHPTADVRGARGAGLTSIWINRGVFTEDGGTAPAPHHEIQDLRGLLPLLRG